MALPVNGSTHLIPAYYSFYRPRKDERLSWPSWLTYSGRFTHISGHSSAAGRAQDRESSPARDRRSTTVPRHQLPWASTRTNKRHDDDADDADRTDGDVVEAAVGGVFEVELVERQNDLMPVGDRDVPDAVGVRRVGVREVGRHQHARPSRKHTATTYMRTHTCTADNNN